MQQRGGVFKQGGVQDTGLSSDPFARLSEGSASEFK